MRGEIVRSSSQMEDTESNLDYLIVSNYIAD